MAHSTPFGIVHIDVAYDAKAEQVQSSRRSHHYHRSCGGVRRRRFSLPGIFEEMLVEQRAKGRGDEEET